MRKSLQKLNFLSYQTLIRIRECNLMVRPVFHVRHFKALIPVFWDPGVKICIRNTINKKINKQKNNKINKEMYK